MATPTIYPGNTLTVRIKVPAASGGTGAVTFIDAGVLRAFLSLTNGNDAAPIAPALDINATYAGNGEWIVQFLGVNLTVALFGDKNLVYLMITHVSGVRAYARVKVKQEKPMLTV